jgi:hypothetical protein
MNQRLEALSSPERRQNLRRAVAARERREPQRVTVAYKSAPE